MPLTDTPPRTALDRDALVRWFLDTRQRSRALFDLLRPEAYYAQPIPLRHPIVFYEGHLTAFAVNTLARKALKHAGLHEEFETLFERGIDPADTDAAAGHAQAQWPDRRDVASYVAAGDQLLVHLLKTADLERSGDPLLDRGNAVFTIIEHELEHQETMLYLWHQLPHALKRHPRDPAEVSAAPAPEPSGPPIGSRAEVPAGRVTLGARRGTIPFGWDNEFPALRVDVPEFTIDVHDVTNGQYLEFVERGAYDDASLWSSDGWAWRAEAAHRHPLFWHHRDGHWFWRGMFEDLPLPLDAPVYVTHAEATAYARWQGARLPAEAEFHRAAYGSPTGEELAQPWGDDPPDASRGNFGFQHWDPVPVGSSPAGQSAWGIHDLVGNGWEWTATPFDGLPGFTPMASYPQYSADFFDGRHFVMKGASPATATELVRRSFRNWFRETYPYMYSTFRCVRS